MRLTIAACIILFFVFIGPILVIWSLNTLFPILDIPYTIETWAAALLFSSIIKTARVSK